MSKARDLANAGTALGVVSPTELGYVDGVTSAIQTQLNAKEATLPDQTGNSGKYLTTNGTAKSWGTVSQYALPSQTGNSGKFLTTNGTSESWAAATIDRSTTPWTMAYTVTSDDAAANESINATTTDSSGNIISAGRAYTAGTHRPIVVKHNSAGIAQWQWIFYSTVSNEATIHDVTTDSSNNVYLVGGYYDGGTSLWRAFLVKLNSSGVLQWQREFRGGQPGGYENKFSGVKVAASGNIYLVGYNVPSGYGRIMAYFVKYNSSGTLQWQRMLDGSTGNLYMNDMVIDSSENIYGVGYFDANSIGTGLDIAVGKYDSTGTFQWAKRYTDSNSRTDLGYAIAIDSSANLYISTSISPSAVSTGNFGVMKLDSSGAILWQRQLAASANTTSAYAKGICLDSSNNVYVVGNMAAQLYPGLYATVPHIAKWNSSGTLQWQGQFLINDAGYGNGMFTSATVSNDGNFVYAAGYANSTHPRGFIAKIKTDGTGTGEYQTQYVSSYYRSTGYAESASAATASSIGSNYTPTYTETAGGLVQVQSPMYSAIGALDPIA